MKIWKYTVPIDGESHTFKANIRRFLAVGNQRGAVVFWAEVGPDAKGCDMTFKVFLTGEDLPDSRYYLGTTWFDTATIHPFVAHLYQIGKDDAGGGS